MKPFVLQICMPEKPLAKDAEVATLVGIHPKKGGTWKGRSTYRVQLCVCLARQCPHFFSFRLKFSLHSKLYLNH